MCAMQPPGERQRHVQNFIISLAAHFLCFLIIIALPMCSFKRYRTPEHKIYTFDLINPALISMKKTSCAPLGADTTALVKQVELKSMCCAVAGEAAALQNRLALER